MIIIVLFQASNERTQVLVSNFIQKQEFLAYFNVVSPTSASCRSIRGYRSILQSLQEDYFSLKDREKE